MSLDYGSFGYLDWSLDRLGLLYEDEDLEQSENS